MNETQLVGNMKVNIDHYDSWNKNRTKKGGGGIATAVSQLFSDCTVGVGEGENEDEYLVTRIEAFTPALNIINYYGEQRNTRKEEVEERWKRLTKEMGDIRLRGEYGLLAGDMNKVVGEGKLGVQGNNKEISLGGKLLRGLLATGDWVLVNGLSKDQVEGGPFTRKDPATGQMSCLDLFVASKELLPYIEKLVIDKKEKFTPGRAIKKKGKYKLINTDHYSCLLTIKDLPQKRERSIEKRTVWNLSKENGWKCYKTYSDMFSEKLTKIISNEALTIEEVMTKFNKVHDKIKFKSFGKVTITNKIKKPTNNEHDEEEITDKAIALFEDQQNEVDKEILKIKGTKNGKVGQIWAIRKSVLGGKNSRMLPRSIFDPKTKKNSDKQDRN